LLFNADDRPSNRIVDIWEVSLGWSLSNSAKFVIDGTMAQTDPSFVGAQVRHRDASQVGTNGRTNQNT